MYTVTNFLHRLNTSTPTPKHQLIDVEIEDFVYIYLMSKRSTIFHLITIVITVLLTTVIIYEYKKSNKLISDLNNSSIVLGNPDPKNNNSESSVVCKRSDNTIVYDSTRCEKIKTYRSTKLGVEFKIHENAKITETDNTIYINGKEGQWVEILPKYNLQSPMDKVIELSGPTYKKCRIWDERNNLNISENIKYPETYNVIIIMANETDLDRSSAGKPLLCQSKYAGLNGMTMFVTDTQTPDKIAYFQIGQYSEPAGDRLDWQHTFRFIK